jgi:hypothetical protein
MQQNFIGIRNVDKTSISGLWLNDLPGVTLKNAANLANEEDVKGEDLMNKARMLAYLEVNDDFLAVLNKDVEFGGSTIASCMGRPGTTEYPFTGTSTLLLQPECVDDLSDIYFAAIHIIAAADGCIDITIDGEDAFQVKLRRGRNTIEVNRWFGHRDIAITATGTGLSLYHWEWLSCNCASCNATGDRIMGVELYEKCSKDLLCRRYADDLKFAYLYKAGINLMHELLTTDRYNEYVRGGAVVAERNLMIWAGGTDIKTGMSVSGQYGEKIKAAAVVAANDLKHTHSRCINCNSRVIHVIP